jgi:hypothetical protein
MVPLTTTINAYEPITIMLLSVALFMMYASSDISVVNEPDVLSMLLSSLTVRVKIRSVTLMTARWAGIGHPD